MLDRQYIVVTIIILHVHIGDSCLLIDRRAVNMTKQGLGACAAERGSCNRRGFAWPSFLPSSIFVLRSTSHDLLSGSHPGSRGYRLKSEAPYIDDGISLMDLFDQKLRLTKRASSKASC